MEIPAVARRYARALYDLSTDEGVTGEVRADLIAIRGLAESTPEFPAFLDNPTLTPATAIRTVDELFDGRLHPATMRFVRFIASKGRLNQLRAVCDAYEQQICEDLGILKVGITAAHDLSDAQLTAMKKKLHAQYGKTIEADVKVDETLIGGFRIQVGDRIRDFSLLNKLDQFEQSVMNAKHEHVKVKVESWH